MANSPSAIKRVRQNETRRARNTAGRSRVRTAVKKVRAAVDAGDLQTAEQLLPDTLSLIDSTAGKSLLHRNTAARTKSRLTRAVDGLRTSS